MTTKVTVEVPIGHSQNVMIKVSYIDEYDNIIQGQSFYLKVGEKRELYATTSRKIVVEEIELK